MLIVPVEPGPRTFGIPELVAMTRKGVIRIPSFHQSFHWSAEDVRKLFDSIYRGFPVGTILFWQHDTALWVVDGRQRITSLFRSLTGHERNGDRRFDVYFDLVTEKFVNSRLGVAPREAIPVNEALQTHLLLNWLRNYW